MRRLLNRYRRNRRFAMRIPVPAAGNCRSRPRHAKQRDGKNGLKLAGLCRLLGCLRFARLCAALLLHCRLVPSLPAEPALSLCAAESILPRTPEPALRPIPLRQAPAPPSALLKNWSAGPPGPAPVPRPSDSDPPGSSPGTSGSLLQAGPESRDSVLPAVSARCDTTL